MAEASRMSSQQQSEVSTGLTDQALLIHCSAENYLTVRHELSTAAFCVWTNRAGRRL